MKWKPALRRARRRLLGGARDEARCVDHDVPERAPAGVVRAARLTVENVGACTWRNDARAGGDVVLDVEWDGVSVEKYALPRARLAPRERATFHFPLRAPDAPGAHALCLRLARREGWKLGENGVVLAQLTVTAVAVARTASDELQDLTTKRNYWCYQPSRGIARGADGRAYPRFFQRAHGSRVRDPEGNEFVDYLMGWGSTLLGYADERVQRAVRDALDTAPTAPLPHALEMDVTQRLVDDIPCAEMVLFGKNGSDACTMAVRLARLFTRKRHVLFSGYHGWQDAHVEHRGFDDSGVPARPRALVHPFRFDDVDDFERAWAAHRRDLAAVMLEPAATWTDLRAGPRGEPSAGFLQHVAERARRAGALLVFDEIVTGYRYPELSFQKRCGVTPDLACFGKALANGMPLAALVGRAHVFQRGLPHSGYGPTFKGEVYSFAAAKAAIEIYRREPVAEHVWRHGERLRDGIAAIARRHGVAARCAGLPYRFALVFDEPDGDRLVEKRTLYLQELFKGGVLSMHGVMLPSYAHDDAALEHALRAADAALELVARAEREDAFDRYLEIPPLLG